MKHKMTLVCVPVLIGAASASIWATKVVPQGLRPTDWLFSLGLAVPFLALAIAYWLLLWHSDCEHRSLRGQFQGLTKQVQCDELTALLNRRGLYDRLQDIVKTKKKKQSGALLLIDLDGFKAVNDTMGHQTGDSLLKLVALRLTRAIPDNAQAARLGGDEFAVLFESIGTDIPAVANRIIRDIALPYTLNGRDVNIGASGGYVEWPRQADSVNDMVARADIALYSAKRTQRGSVVAFDPEDEIDVRHRRFIQRELRAALMCGYIEMHYQPILAADGHRVVAAEALMRWCDPARGFIPPSDFIPIAEENGFIHELGAFAVQRACEDARAWPMIDIAVNVSPLQLSDMRIVDIVAAALTANAMAPSRLILEITESAFLAPDSAAEKVLAELRKLGVRIALDDFGAGYSSLACLTRIPIDKLKIDRSLVAGLDRSADAGTIMHAVLALARGLNLAITAEGIETAAEHRFLVACGCREFQGYHFARPGPAHELSLRLGLDIAHVTRRKVA